MQHTVKNIMNESDTAEFRPPGWQWGIYNCITKLKPHSKINLKNCR